MRKGFNVIELLVVIAIIMILVGMLVPAISLVIKQGKMVKPQTNAIMAGTKEQVYVVAKDYRTSPTTYIIRKSDGTELHVNIEELLPIQPKVKVEKE